jgi:hypothetical protein
MRKTIITAALVLATTTGANAICIEPMTTGSRYPEHIEMERRAEREYQQCLREEMRKEIECDNRRDPPESDRDYQLLVQCNRPRGFR